MASELLNARADFSNFGSTLSAIQQNARDDMISNNSALQNYMNVNAQIKASIPSSFGEIAFGAYELLGQSKDLLSRFSKVKSDIAALPDAAKDSLVKLGNKLGARVQDAGALAADTRTALQSAATEVGSAAQGIAGQATNLASQTASDIASRASTIATDVRGIPIITPEEDIFSSSYNLASQLRAPAEEAVSRFVLPLATKRPATLGVAEPITYENIRQKALRMVEPEEAETAAPRFSNIIPAGVGEEILPNASALLQRPAAALANLQEAAGSGLNAAAVSAREAGTAAMQGAADLGASAAQTASSLVPKITETATSALSAGKDIVAGAASDVAGAAAEVSASLLPVVGEVTALGLGGLQIYEGFKDLFDHPSASKPISFPMPSVANVAQSFQSGI